MVRLRKIVAEVSLPPQQQNASHRLHRFTQMLLTSGGALVSSAPTEQYRYTSCYVGALETSAPPWRHPNNLCRSVKSVGEQSQQELLWILWNLWENLRTLTSVQICEICGRTSIFPQNPRNSQNLLAEKSLPQIAQIITDATNNAP